MQTRTTRQDLEALARQISNVTDAPVEPYTKGKANIGCYHISGENGGYALHKVVSPAGGTADVFSSGHIPAKDLFVRMKAFLIGWGAPGR